MSDAPSRVLVVNLGTPKAPTPAAVRAFLSEFLSDPMVVGGPRWLWLPLLHGVILRRRPDRVAALYEKIWTDRGSPLADGTADIAEALGAALPGAEVRACYRYGSPNLEQLMNSAADPARTPPRSPRIIVLPLFFHRTGSSHGTIAAETRRLAAAGGLTGSVAVATVPPDDPDYIAALAEQTLSLLGDASGPAGRPERLLLSFHSIPLSHIRREGGLYREDCERTSRALLARLRWPEERAEITFQSRFGPAKWLGPSTAERLAALPREGVRRVALIAPGFITEGLETLEELDLRGAETFRAAGGEQFLRIPAVGAHPRLIRALKRAAASRLPATPA